MTSSKQKQTQQQSYSGTNQYGYETPPDTADVQAVRGFEFGVDPSIATAYGAAKNKIANQFSSPISGSYTPAMRDAILRSQYRDLAQQQAGAHSAAYADTQGSRFGQKAAVAAMTAPRLVQTGQSGSSSGTGQQTYSPSPLSTVMDIVGGVSTGAAA